MAWLFVDREALAFQAAADHRGTRVRRALRAFEHAAMLAAMFRCWGSVTPALLATLSPQPASAAEAVPGPKTVQAELALATGVSLPLADAQQGAGLHDEVKVAFPIAFGFGARLLERAFAGGEVVIGPAMMGDAPPDDSACDVARAAGNRCSVLLQRVIGVAGYHPLTGGVWDPWVRLGLGYEWLRFHGVVPIAENTDPNVPPGQRGDVRVALKGWTAQLRVGLDYALPALVRVGPYLSLDLGRYAERDIDEDGTNPRLPVSDVSIDDRALHWWIGGGVRIALVVP